MKIMSSIKKNRNFFTTTHNSKTMKKKKKQNFKYENLRSIYSKFKVKKK